MSRQRIYWRDFYPIYQNSKFKDKYSEVRWIFKLNEGYTNDLESRIAQQEEIIKELKNILLDAGAKTHKSKMLHDWYCENAEEIIGDKNE